MSESFYVVSKASADDATYLSGVVFNANDTDNEAAATEYASELAASKPWQAHSVLSAEDFEKYDKEADADTVTVEADANPVTVDNPLHNADNGTD